MKKIFLILFLIPILLQAQIEKRLPHKFYDDVTFLDSVWLKNLKLGTDTAGVYIIGISKGTGSSVKIYPSLLGGGGAGTVTSVASGYGTNFSTITGTGSVIIDSSGTIMTKNTTQWVTGGKFWNAQQTFYENSVNGGTIIILRNDGSNSSTKIASIGLPGQTGSSITGLPNALLLENQAAGGLTLSSYGGSGVKFMYGTGRSILQNNSITGAFFGGNTSATAQVQIAAGTATSGTAPLKFTTASAALLSSPEVGTVEVLSDKIYYTIPTGTSRKEFTLNDAALTDGRLPYVTNGRLATSTSYFSGTFLGVGLTNPAATITSAGSFGANIQTITGNTTVDNTYYTILVDASGGAVTVSLPTSSLSSKIIYHIKKIDASGNSVTIDPNSSEVIDGSATASLITQWSGMTIQCNGTQWYIIGVF